MPNLSLENFDQSEGSIQSHMTTMEASDWSKFSNGRFLNMTAKVWNECPRDIKEEINFEKAKLLIKAYCRNLPI